MHRKISNRSQDNFLHNPIYPVRKPRSSAAGIVVISFSANPVRDLSLNGANTGVNPLRQRFRGECPV